MVVTVIFSSTWGLGTDGDLWQVEIPSSATVAELKNRIEELYEVPRYSQKLALSENPSEPALADEARLESIAARRIYLLPADPSPEEAEERAEMESAVAEMAEAFAEAAQEHREVSQAVYESLQGVTYSLRFQRPESAGGSAAGRVISLTFEALTLVADMQQIVEVELLGSSGAEPAFLVFEGSLLPPDLCLYAVGLDNGKTVTVAREAPPPTEEEQHLLQELLDLEGQGVITDTIEGPSGPSGYMDNGLFAHR